ncbi:DNA translocase FtsK 4TM domain-containing protein [Patescibacteria group bacterium]|nr:DNA translocase FtsK 4TM domain-containing protein [Patescibacteria group bacterium]
MPRRRKTSFRLDLDPETQRSIAVVCLFAASVFILLSVFQAGGSAGMWLENGLSLVFGWDKIFLPFFLMAWGYYLVAPDRLPLRIKNVIGIFLFFLSLNPLVHVFSFPGIQHLDVNVLRVVGGRLGEVIALPLTQVLGVAGSLTVLLGLFVLSILLMFNLNVQDILAAWDWIRHALLTLLEAISLPVKQFIRWREKRPARAAAAEDLPSALSSSLPPPAMETEEDDEEEEELDEAMEAAPGEEEDEEVDEEEEEAEGDAVSPAANILIAPKPKKRYPKVEIPFDLLDRRDQKPTSGDINHNREVVRRTLEKFGIPVEMSDVSVGPTVTQFTLKPADGVKLARITTLHNDLALALAAHPIRIEAPIPGKSLVGIEVPNQSVATVGLREIFESKEFRERKSNLFFALGKDVGGKPWMADLSRMPHLLVAGSTGSGKSVCLNTMIMSFLYSNGPEDMKLIMVDPKRVELQVYNGIPHLVTPVITKTPEAVNALKWALREMDHRYDLLAKFNARDLLTYNSRAEEKIPYLAIIIDELADLMTTSASEIEGPIVRLAQMSRAVGIHLILATQRPSVDVITGLIKANIPGRIAFAVASATDSRTILDQSGAEKLLGRGDMLFSTSELGSPKRVQGAFISDTEISRVIDFIKSKYEPVDYDYAVVERAKSGGSAGGGQGFSDEDSDALLEEAREEILRAGKASASLLQRRLKVGYARAARLLDLLEQEGFIGPADGAKPREILQADFTHSSTAPPPGISPSSPPEDVEL